MLLEEESSALECSNMSEWIAWYLCTESLIDSQRLQSEGEIEVAPFIYMISKGLWGNNVLDFRS